MKNLKRITSSVVAMGMLTAALLSTAACDKRQQLIVYNWGEYIAEETIDKFQQAYYCTKKGSWGGKYYEEGKNYNGVD